MALQDIPAAWRSDVCRILRTGDPKMIERTTDFVQRLQGSFPDSWEYEVREAFVAYLRQPYPKGCPVSMAHPPGESWEFFFLFRNKLTYGKILLRTDRRRVVLFSSHRPDKDKLRCE